jgi:hypothetical protein
VLLLEQEPIIIFCNSFAIIVYILIKGFFITAFAIHKFMKRWRGILQVIVGGGKHAINE